MFNISASDEKVMLSGNTHKFIKDLCAQIPQADKKNTFVAHISHSSVFSISMKTFRLMGKQDESEDLALLLLSAIQGAVVLAQSFQVPEYFEREAGRLKEWIRTL